MKKVMMAILLGSALASTGAFAADSTAKVTDSKTTATPVKAAHTGKHVKHHKAHKKATKQTVKTATTESAKK